MAAAVRIETTALPIAVTWLQQAEFPHKLGILDRIFGRSLSRRGVCWVDTAAKILWKLDLSNSTHRWIAYGKYEGPGFLKWASNFLPKNGIVVDSGANIGQMLMYLAQMVPKGRVLAFEPGVKQANWLAECLAINPSLPVELIRRALGASTGTAFLNDDGQPNTHGGQSQISETTGMPIQIVPLAEELRCRSISGLDLWKLDIEGYEIPALKGAHSLLEAGAIQAIYAELHEENGLLIRDYLAALGYRCHLITPNGTPRLLKEAPRHCNGLFLRSSQPK